MERTTDIRKYASESESASTFPLYTLGARAFPAAAMAVLEAERATPASKEVAPAAANIPPARAYTFSPQNEKWFQGPKGGPPPQKRILR